MKKAIWATLNADNVDIASRSKSSLVQTTTGMFEVCLCDVWSCSGGIKTTETMHMPEKRVEEVEMEAAVDKGTTKSRLSFITYWWPHQQRWVT